jgi:glycosyltransferase involved in cell wall biosynthesis
MTPVPVVQITETLLVGGMEQVVVSLCQAMDRERWTPHVVCLKHGGPLADACAAMQVPVYVVAEHARNPYLAFTTLARHLRDLNAAVVHTHNTSGFIWGGLSVLLAGTPRWIHTEHGRAFPDLKRRVIAERLLSHRADAVVGVSDQATADLAQWVGIAPSKLVTIANGVPASRIPEPDRAGARAALGLANDAVVIGTLARLLPEKGIDRLLRSFAVVHRENPAAQLVLCGDGDARSALEALAASLGVTAAVHFTGMRLDAPKLLAAFDLFALSSVREGLPMALLESLAAGVPIVSMNVGGVARAVRPGLTGVLVPDGDEAALAAALLDLLADPAERARLGSNARRVFREEFTAESMVARYESLYRDGAAALPALRRRRS